MKKALKNIGRWILAVCLYLVYAIDRVLTAPFPVFQPSAKDWDGYFLKNSCIRVGVTTLVLSIYLLTNIYVTLAVIAFCVILYIALRKFE